MILPITLTFATAAALLNLWLGMRVSQLRLRHKVLVGHGDDPRVESRMRAHANFVEYTPFVLILMALIELAHGWPLGLWLVGLLYIIARLAHPIGMERPAPNLFRAAGAVVSWAVLLVLAGWALAIAYRLA